MNEKLHSSFPAIAVLIASAASAGADTSSYSWDGSANVLPDIYAGGEAGYTAVGGTYEMADGRLHVSSPGGTGWINNSFDWSGSLADDEMVSGSMVFRVNAYTNDLDGTHGGCGRVRLFWFNATYDNGLNAFMSLYGSDKWMTLSAGWGPGGHVEWNKWEFNPDRAGAFAPAGKVYVYNSFNMKDPAKDTDFYRAIDLGTDHVLTWSAQYLSGCDVVEVTTALDDVPWTTTSVNRNFKNLGWAENALAKQHGSMQGPWDAEYTHLDWATGPATILDCNANSMPDSCDIAAGTSDDTNSNGIPDECEGGLRLPGDANGDDMLDLSDAVAVLWYLFHGTDKKFPCGDGSSSDPGNVSLLDWQEDGAIRISDIVAMLSFLFLEGSPHVLAVPGAPSTGCVRIAGCSDSCAH